MARATRAIANGSSQSSVVEDGRTEGEVSARVVRYEEGKAVYEVTDGATRGKRTSGQPREEEFHLAPFTDLIRGIDPDLTSYPHQVFGKWAWDGNAGAFLDRSPSIPRVQFDSQSPM